MAVPSPEKWTRTHPRKGHARAGLPENPREFWPAEEQRAHGLGNCTHNEHNRMHYCMQFFRRSDTILWPEKCMSFASRTAVRSVARGNDLSRRTIMSPASALA